MVSLASALKAAAVVGLGAVVTTPVVRAEDPPIQEFNISVSDIATFLTYDPPVRMPADNGSSVGLPEVAWNQTWEGTPWSNYSTFQLGSGRSAHVTSFPGATVKLSWVGTGVYFWGVLDTDSNVELKVDGATVDAPAGNASLMAAVSGLSFGKHDATLTLSSGRVQLQNVTVTTGMYSKQPTGGTINSTDINALLRSNKDTYINPLLTTRENGPDTQWAKAVDIGNKEPPRLTTFERINSGQKGARVEMDIPPRTGLFQVYGAVSHNHGRYTVQVSPALPFDMASEVQHSSFSPFTGIGAPMYMAVLDPTVQYHLTILNDDQLYTDLSKFVVYTSDWGGNNSESDNSGGGSNKSNVGAIAGGVVGGVLGAALLGGLMWWFCLRKKDTKSSPHQRRSFAIRHRPDAQPIEQFEIDGTAASPTPYSESSYSGQPMSAAPTSLNYAALDGTPSLASSGSDQRNAFGDSQSRALRRDTRLSSSSPTDSTLDSTWRTTHAALSSSSGGHGGPWRGLGQHTSSNFSAGASGAAVPQIDSSANAVRAPLGSDERGAYFAAAETLGAPRDDDLKSPLARELAAQPTRLRQPEAVVTQAQDSGVVFEEVVPPVYDPQWEERYQRDQAGRG